MRDTPIFLTELWKLLHSASQSPTGIPAEMLEKTKQDIREREVCVCTLSIRPPFTTLALTIDDLIVQSAQQATAAAVAPASRFSTIASSSAAAPSPAVQ